MAYLPHAYSRSSLREARRRAARTIAGMESTDLRVDAEKKLPAICLKCAARKKIIRRSERLTTATASQGLGAVGGVCGAMVARTLKDDALLGALVLGGSIAASIAVGYALNAHAPKVELALPLCRGCDERWSAGIHIRHGILGGLGLSMLAFAYGFFGHDTDGYIVGGGLIALPVIVALATGLRHRFVHAASIQGSQVVLRGVSVEAARAIAERL